MSARRPNVVVTHWVHPEVVEYLTEFCHPSLPSREVGVWSRAQVLDLATDAEGLITCMADTIDDAFLARCRRLRVVSATLKGYDNFDAEACTRRGIWLTIVPDIIIAPTAELAVGLVIGIMRRVGEADRLMRDGGFGGWRPQLYGSSLDGATVGLVGMGPLGRALAERLTVFGARIVYHDIQALPAAVERALPATGLGLHKVFEASDVIVVLLPLTERTVGLVDRSTLGLLRPGAFEVNVGRGSVIDEEAVAEALADGRLGGYAADVFAMEDRALPDHPERIPPGLLDHPRTLLTPHLGSAVDDVRRDMSLEAARQVRQALDGQRPDHPVNQPKLATARRPGGAGS
jgi:phosphonate dehydrogenase